MVSELAGEGAMPPQLPTPARRLLEIAKLRDRLCRPIRRRRVGAAVGGGGGLAIVDALKPVSLRAIVSFILLFLQINKSLSTVLFKSNQPTSWSRSVRYSSKVLVNPLYAGVNRNFRRRSAKRTSAEFVNPSSVAIIIVPGADPWKARVQNSFPEQIRGKQNERRAHLYTTEKKRMEKYAAESKLAENIAFGEEVSKPESAIILSTKQTAKELGRDRIKRSARSMMKRWSTWSSSMIDLRCYRFMMFIDFTEYWLRCQVRGHEDDVRGVCLCGSIDIAASGSKEFPVSVVKREDTHEVICVASKLVRRRRTAATEKEDAVCPESLNYVADTLQNAQISEFEISQDDASNTWHVVGSGLQRFIQKTNSRYIDSDRRFQNVSSIALDSSDVSTFVDLTYGAKGKRSVKNQNVDGSDYINGVIMGVPPLGHSRSLTRHLSSSGLLKGYNEQNLEGLCDDLYRMHIGKGKERMDHLLEMSKWQKKWYHGGESKFQNPCVMNKRSFGDGEGLLSQGAMEMMMEVEADKPWTWVEPSFCIMKRVFDQGTFQDVQLIFDGTIDHIVEFMVDQFGNYLMQKLLNFCNNEQRMQILLRVIREPDS
nr:GTP-binding protein OBGC, chloroplastic [Ipomoea batatas]